MADYKSKYTGAQIDEAVGKALAGGSGGPGVSPTVEVSKSGKTTTLTITDAQGIKTAEIQDGVDVTSVYQKTTSLEDGGENILVIETSDGKINNFEVRNGKGGKSAYQYAQDGGYTGTEAEFAAKLAAEQATSNPLTGKKVSFLGDSICAGGTESTSYLGGYGKIIADRNGMVYENVAHGGATITAETYSRSTGNAKPWLCRMVANMSADADYAIIEGGINDGWDDTVRSKIGSITKGYDAVLDDTTYYGAFESMLKQLVTKFQGKKIGYIAVPKIHSLFDSSQNAPNFYHIALECCAKWGVPVCDLNTITPPVEYLADLGTTYTADACHPTYEGYLKYYCDPIEAWMKTLTTGASVSVGTPALPDLDSTYMRKTDVQVKKAQLTLEDGSTVLIDVVVASAGTTIQKWINLIPTSIDTDKSVYNGTGWKGDTRLSASSGSVKENTTGASITGFIPVKKGDVVRFKFTTANHQLWDAGSMNLGWNIIAYYDSSFTWLGSSCPLQSGGQIYGICTAADHSTGSSVNGGIVSFTVPSNTDIAYVRLSFGDQSFEGLSSLIVTVNQEIT